MIQKSKQPIILTTPTGWS